MDSRGLLFLTVNTCEFFFISVILCYNLHRYISRKGMERNNDGRPLRAPKGTLSFVLKANRACHHSDNFITLLAKLSKVTMMVIR